MGNGHLGMFRVACCAAVWSGIVSADVIKQGGFNLGLDVVVVDALTNKPWDPGVRGVQGIGQECVSVLKLETCCEFQHWLMSDVSKAVRYASCEHNAMVSSYVAVLLLSLASTHLMKLNASRGLEM